MNFKLKNKSILLYKQNKREYLIEMPHYHYLFFKLLFFIKNFKKQIMIKKIKKTKLITRILNPILITRWFDTDFEKRYRFNYETAIYSY